MSPTMKEKFYEQIKETITDSNKITSFFPMEENEEFLGYCERIGRSKFGFSQLHDFQKQALGLLNEGEGKILVNSYTGSGKSLIF